MLKQKRKRKRNTGKSDSRERISMRRYFNTTSKVMVWFVVLNAEIQVYLCYRLAFLGQITALESLGQTIVLEIIAPVMLLIVKAVLENIFEKNIIFPHKNSSVSTATGTDSVNTETEEATI